MKKICLLCGYRRIEYVYNSNYCNVICVRYPEYPELIDQSVSSLYHVSVAESSVAIEMCSKDPVDLFNYQAFKK